MDLLAAHPVSGMAHITGGGLTENIIRAVPEGLGIEIDASAWTVPPVFEWLRENGNISEAEMRRTFNMGVGYVLMVPEGAAGDVLAASDGALAIGHVVDASAGGNRVRFV